MCVRQVDFRCCFYCWKCWNVENSLCFFSALNRRLIPSVSVFDSARNQFCVLVLFSFRWFVATPRHASVCGPFDPTLIRFSFLSLSLLFRNPIDDLAITFTCAINTVFVASSFWFCCCLFYLWLILVLFDYFHFFGCSFWCKSPSVSVNFFYSGKTMFCITTVISFFGNRFWAFDCVVAAWTPFYVIQPFFVFDTNKYLLIIKREIWTVVLIYSTFFQFSVRWLNCCWCGCCSEYFFILETVGLSIRLFMLLSLFVRLYLYLYLYAWWKQPMKWSINLRHYTPYAHRQSIGKIFL